MFENAPIGIDCCSKRTLQEIHRSIVGEQHSIFVRVHKCTRLNLPLRLDVHRASVRHGVHSQANPDQRIVSPTEHERVDRMESPAMPTAPGSPGVPGAPITPCEPIGPISPTGPCGPDFGCVNAEHPARAPMHTKTARTTDTAAPLLNHFAIEAVYFVKVANRCDVGCQPVAEVSCMLKDVYPQIGPMLGRSNCANPKVESAGPNRTSTLLTEVLERNLSPCNTIE